MLEPSSRGRPPRAHDNARVSAFMGSYLEVGELLECWPRMDDILTGVAHLQSEGQGSTRPMSKRLLFRVLRSCPLISTQAAAVALGLRYSLTSAKRYAASAVVASRAVLALLVADPRYEAAGGLAADREALDAPYRHDLRAVGLVAGIDLSSPIERDPSRSRSTSSPNVNP